MMKMNRLLFYIGAGTGLILGGCSSESQIGDENAIEVALDEVKANQEDVTNLSCDNSEEGYTVSFDLNGLQYIYKISDLGIIESSRTKELSLTKKLTKADAEDYKAKINEEALDNKDPEKQQEEPTNKLENSEEIEQSHKPPVAPLISQSDASLIALDYLYVTENDVTKLKSVLNDSNNYNVSYKYDSYNCNFVIDSNNGDILSAVIQ